MVISPARALALCRIGFGAYFIAQAWDKTTKNWLVDGGPFVVPLIGNPNATPPTRGFAANAEPFYRVFLESIVAPNALLFSQLVTLGEWAAGLSLLLGFLTRLGALISIVLVVNYMFLKGLASLGGSSDRLFALVSLAFLLASAGLAWGLDGALRQQLAGNGLTRWLAGLPAPPGRADEQERVEAPLA